jgi:hypothetical protein
MQKIRSLGWLGGKVQKCKIVNENFFWMLRNSCRIACLAHPQSLTCVLQRDDDRVLSKKATDSSNSMHSLLQTCSSIKSASTVPGFPTRPAGNSSRYVSKHYTPKD